MPWVIKLLEWFVYVNFIFTPEESIFPGSEFRTDPEVFGAKVSEHFAVYALKWLSYNHTHVDTSSPAFMLTRG